MSKTEDRIEQGSKMVLKLCHYLNIIRNLSYISGCGSENQRNYSNGYTMNTHTTYENAGMYMNQPIPALGGRIYYYVRRMVVLGDSRVKS